MSFKGLLVLEWTQKKECDARVQKLFNFLVHFETVFNKYLSSTMESFLVGFECLFVLDEAET